MKQILTLTCLLFFVYSYSQSYNISGEIENGENKTIYLLNPSQIEIDSTIIKNKSFSFKGSVKEPNVYFLKVKDFQGAATILLDNSIIKIEANAEKMWSAKKTGSKLLQENKAFHQSLSEYYNLQNDAFDKAMDAMNNNDSINALKYEDLNIHYTQVINDSTQNYIYRHSNSYVSLIQLKEKLEILPIESSKKLYENFSSNLKNHSIGKDIHYRLYIYPNTVNIGNMAPDIEAVTINNELIKLSNFKGKYVLLDFWASWCAPCRKEIPLLKQLYEDYHSKGFEILSFSLDTKNENLKRALDKENFKWESISDLKGFQSEVAKRYNVTEIPKNLVISPEGKIIEMNKHDADLQNLLSSIFNK